MSNVEVEIAQQNDAPVILAVETATRAGSVGVARGYEVLACVAGNASSSHSTDLIENIDRVLRGADLQLSDVDLFGAATGPGSFTGLRIGLATVKSLAVAMNKKCIGVSTLAAVAHAAGQSRRTVALLPAGRGEVFAQMFSVTGNDVFALDQAMHISPEVLLAKYSSFKAITWAGEGAHAQLKVLRAEADRRQIPFALATGANGGGWAIAPHNENIAASIAQLSAGEYDAGRTIEPADLHANYVRPSDAEMKVHA
jgi:tRNA threonylcarbamoyladenosine biosynthesis protein TsaB